jgi:hypothetical protein
LKSFLEYQLRLIALAVAWLPSAIFLTHSFVQQLQLLRLTTGATGRTQLETCLSVIFSQHQGSHFVNQPMEGCTTAIGQGLEVAEAQLDLK